MRRRTPPPTPGSPGSTLHGRVLHSHRAGLERHHTALSTQGTAQASLFSPDLHLPHPPLMPSLGLCGFLIKSLKSENVALTSVL